MVRKLLLIGGLYVLLAGSAVTYFLVTGKLTNEAKILDPIRIAEGKTIYAEHCASCHGVNLEGEPNWEEKRADGTYPAPPQNENGHTWQHSDRQIYNYIEDGGAKFYPPPFKTNMPGYKDALTSKQIWSLISYIKSR